MKCKTCDGKGFLVTYCDPLTCGDGWSCAGGCEDKKEPCYMCDGTGEVEPPHVYGDYCECDECLDGEESYPERAAEDRRAAAEDRREAVLDDRQASPEFYR